MIKITNYTVILSGKGRVGKTTTSVNLGISLMEYDQRVTVVDTNMATPNVALQLGFPPNQVNLSSVMRNQANIYDAVSLHESGLRVVAGRMSLTTPINNYVKDFRDALAPLSEDNDFVLMDCEAGLWGRITKAVKAANEAIIVTNPELPAIIDSLKSIRMAEKLGTDVRGVVLNKVTGSKYELNDETIEGILKDYPIIGRIPYDKNVMKSLSERKPVVTYKPKAPASRAFKRLAAEIVGEDYSESFFQRVSGFFH